MELVPFLLQSGFTEKDAARFIEKIDDTGGPDACWEWTACTNRKGYGGFRFKTRIIRPSNLVCKAIHRLEPPLLALHSCDNKACCNPNHLSPGTNAENMQQAAQRLRVGIQKLTPFDVRAIRVWLLAGYPQRKIAKMFGVARTTISRIKGGSLWSHLKDEHSSVRLRSRRALSDSHQNPLHRSP